MTPSLIPTFYGLKVPKNIKHTPLSDEELGKKLIGYTHQLSKIFPQDSDLIQKGFHLLSQVTDHKIRQLLCDMPANIRFTELSSGNVNEASYDSESKTIGFKKPFNRQSPEAELKSLINFLADFCHEGCHAVQDVFGLLQIHPNLPNNIIDVINLSLCHEAESICYDVRATDALLHTLKIDSNKYKHDAIFNSYKKLQKNLFSAENEFLPPNKQRDLAENAFMIALMQFPQRRVKFNSFQLDYQEQVNKRIFHRFHHFSTQKSNPILSYQLKAYLKKYPSLESVLTKNAQTPWFRRSERISAVREEMYKQTATSLSFNQSQYLETRIQKQEHYEKRTFSISQLKQYIQEKAPCLKKAIDTPYRYRFKNNIHK